MVDPPSTEAQYPIHSPGNCKDRRSDNCRAGEAKWGLAMLQGESRGNSTFGTLRCISSGALQLREHSRPKAVSSLQSPSEIVRDYEKC